MKKIGYRITKNWIFWMILFASIFSILIYSVSFFVNGSEGRESYRWQHGIGEYYSEDELAAQIKEANTWKEDVKRNPKAYEEEYGIPAEQLYVYVEETIEILNYLKDNQILYEDAMEGNIVFEDNRDVRSYSIQILDTCFIFQIVAAILLLCIIVNQGRSGGAFVFDVLMRGRKACFVNESKTFFVVMTIFYVIQVTFISVLRTLLPVNTKYLVYTNKNGVTAITEIQEYISNIVALYLLLLFYWCLLFFVSQIVRKLLSYLVIAPAVVVVVWLLINLAANSPIALAWNALATMIYDYNISWGWYIVVSVIRLLAGGLLVVLAYRSVGKRQIHLGYE